jgi:hypothetical protein
MSKLGKYLVDEVLKDFQSVEQSFFNQNDSTDISKNINESAAIDSGEPEVGYYADGTKRILNGAKPENWFKQGGYIQLDKPKSDYMRGKGKSKDTQSQFRKVIYKLQGVTEPAKGSPLTPYQIDKWKNVTPKTLKPKNPRYWELEKVDEDISIPINVGDTVLGGKFKNKKIIVKDIGKNEKGDITINGKPLLKYRLIDEAYAEVIAELRKDPQFEEFLSEIPMSDLQQIDKYADKQLDPLDVVITDKHFLDRLIDPRNKKPISAAELTGFFKRLSRKKDQFVDFLKKYGEIVAKDNRTKINIPFMKQANKAIAKTIMRKDDFKTPSPELKFEIEKVSGGLSSGMTLSDIAKKHGVGIDSIKSELIKGVKVEMEHTANAKIAREIAMDHLAENPKYYTKLATIEEASFNPDIVPKKNVWYQLDDKEVLVVSDNIIDLIKTAYNSTKLGSFVTSKSDLTRSIFWKSIDNDTDPHADAVIFGRKSPNGIKIQGIGHDGDKNSKDDIIKKLVSILKTPGYWIEASDALEHVLYKNNVPYVSSEKVGQSIFPNTNLKMIGDKGKYERTLENGTKIRETIFGRPKVSVRETDTNENLMIGYPDQKWMDNHKKRIDKLRAKLDAEKQNEYTMMRSHIQPSAPMKGLYSDELDESNPSDVIKDLDKVKNDLLKKVDVLIAKKKKLYSNVDIESPMSVEEKQLDKEIADIFSQINKLVLQKRTLKKESNHITESVKDYVVVYAGRFQPFHKGHFATYQHLVKKFGKDKVYIGTSDKTDNVKSPFSFNEKKLIMAGMFGIPSDKIVQIKNPYAPVEILKKFDENNTGFITVVGGKDAQRLGGKYFTPYKGNVDVGYVDAGYVYVSPPLSDVSGTDVRKWLGSGDIEDRKKLFTKAYPKFNEKIFNLIVKRLDSLKENVIGKNLIEEFKLNENNLNKAIHEIEKLDGVDFWHSQNMFVVTVNYKKYPNSVKKIKSIISKYNIKNSKLYTGSETSMTNTKDEIEWRIPYNKNTTSENLIKEGGAYGHMNHPFDIDVNLTFGQLKDIVKKALNGELELTREKTDGQALAVSWVNGRLVAARNKSHLKNKGKDAMDINAVASKFANRGGLTDAYNFAMKDLSAAIDKLTQKQKDKIFGGGSKFMNLEVIYPTSVNVIPYGQALLVFHGTFEYDEDGNIIGEDQSAGRILAGMIKQINQNVQSKYTIQGPPVVKLPKNTELNKSQSKFLGMISKLQNEYGLSDNQGVAEYHQKWWEEFVNKNAPNLDGQHKIGLVKRWAFMDKSFRIKDIQDEKIRNWAEKIDKEDQTKISKENLMKFEKIFLGVGAEVLSFMSSVLTVNPDSARRAMVGRLEKTIKDVEAKGSEAQIAKLKLELQRLNDIGGFEKIVPIEGIVFVYNGTTMKLTGSFAAANQLLGIFFDNR